MRMDRRHFMARSGEAVLTGAVLGRTTRSAVASDTSTAIAQSDSHAESWMGVLVDIPDCVGCRDCEYACREAAGFDVPPIGTFNDTSLMAQYRRPAPDSYTVVNRFRNPTDASKPIYVKTNCFHCNEPACASACLVGALRKEANGAVTYDASKCMGCRYCMVACPFQIPTYDYDNAFTPQVRKCSMCYDRVKDGGDVPACVRICPQECLKYGKREALLALAHEKIRRHPDRYVDHVYGEHEAGGSSWLYLSSVPFEELGFLTLGPTVPSRLTESVQHGIFKFFIPPLALYGLLGLVMWLTKRTPDITPVPAGPPGK